MIIVQEPTSASAGSSKRATDLQHQHDALAVQEAIHRLRRVEQIIVEEPNRVECLFLKRRARRKSVGRNPPFRREGRARLHFLPGGCSVIDPPAGGDLQVLAILRLGRRSQHMDRHPGKTVSNCDGYSPFRSGRNRRFAVRPPASARSAGCRSQGHLTSHSRA